MGLFSHFEWSCRHHIRVLVLEAGVRQGHCVCTTVVRWRPSFISLHIRETPKMLVDLVEGVADGSAEEIPIDEAKSKV
jgi:hypothetical protein